MTEPIQPLTARVVAAHLEVALGYIESGRVERGRGNLRELLVKLNAIADKKETPCTVTP